MVLDARGFKQYNTGAIFGNVSGLCHMIEQKWNWVFKEYKCEQGSMRNLGRERMGECEQASYFTGSLLTCAHNKGRQDTNARARSSAEVCLSSPFRLLNIGCGFLNRG